MKILRTLRNYFFYCGIEKYEYNSIKKDAYVSNFEVWRVLHYFMVVFFAVMLLCTFFSDLLRQNRTIYIIALIYSVFAVILFFVLRKDSIIAQLLIYLSISLLFLFSCFITQKEPDDPAVTFIALLLITPMFMIDKPFFMTFVLIIASGIFLFWMKQVKPYEVWLVDCLNVIPFTIVGIFLHIIANSIRIKEFVLTRKINIQKDTDDLTGIKNKGALSREIDKFLADPEADKGIMLLFDVDDFKSINDKFGHDIGDSVISQIGAFIGSEFDNSAIVGRFGGDEFVVFIKDSDDPDTAYKIAQDISKGISENIFLPIREQKVSSSIGIAIYTGVENNFYEILKKADKAMYAAKDNKEHRIQLY